MTTSVLHKYRNAVGVLIVLHHSAGRFTFTVQLLMPKFSLSTLLNVFECKQVKKHAHHKNQFKTTDVMH